MLEAPPSESILDDAPTPSESGPEPEPESDPARSGDTPAFEVDTPSWGSGPQDREAESDFSIEPTSPASIEDTSSPPADEWVFETDPEIDPDSLDIETVETVPPEAESTSGESSLVGGSVDFGTSGIAPRGGLVADDESSTEPEPEAGFEPYGEPEPEAKPEPAPDPMSGHAPASEPEAEPPIGAFTFGKRDPTDKARRLARVLVSDMIMYNPDRHDRALANGTLKRDFEDEIKKSWKEYVEQVGDEMANSNDFWTEALNDVLAKGQPIF